MFSPPIPKRKPPAAPWVRRAVQIDRNDRKLAATVAAECYGPFAVHPGVGREGEGLYALTHEPTGLRVVLLPTDGECKKLGELLWSKWCRVFAPRTAAEVRERLPAWMFRWLKTCHKDQAVVDYSSFQEKDTA